MMTVDSVRSGGAGSIKAPLYVGLFVLVAVLLSLVAFSGALRELVRRWIAQDEYSHGFFIPLVSGWLLWSRRDALLGSIGRPAWSGLALLLLASCMHIVGEVSAFFLFSQVGFVVALMGIMLCAGGHFLLRVTFIPIVFLLFAIPTPYFLDSVLSWRLQLISSALGVSFIRMFDVPVYLTGNIIDFGHYKLQVVDACSGLRYLYPLMSLGFLAAYLFQAPLWKRAIVFLSTIPITIVMNSLRIGMIGVLVDRWGPQMADGLLHFFEGWIIFLACAGLLAVEIYLLRLGSGKSLFNVFYLPKIALSVPSGADNNSANGSGRRAPLTAGLLLLCATAATVLLVSARQEIWPERTRFVEFPKQLGQWTGRASLLDPQIEHVLGLDDYILADYSMPTGRAVNFYVAYYASQRKGASPHSPIVCIPGGGWQIASFEREIYRNAATGVTIPFNRVIIAKDSDKQLVYYWFVQRGRNIANEYWSKWYLLVDAITQNRTDGALVRVTTPFYATESEREADTRIQSFIRNLEPNLKAYLPPAELTGTKSARINLHKS